MALNVSVTVVDGKAVLIIPPHDKPVEITFPESILKAITIKEGK